MDLTSVQHRQADAVWYNVQAILNRTTANTKLFSPTAAFIFLGLANIPAPAAYYIVKARTTRQALKEWPETWNARWVAHYFPDQKPSLMAEHVSSQVRKALQELASQLALSPLSSTKERWWTVITANFTHFNLSHFVGNMLALNAIAPACIDVPGMSALHVLGISLTASLATSLHALHRFSGLATPFSGILSWNMCGFSAVACAFTSVAALGAPFPQRDADGEFPPEVKRVWTVAGLQLLSDVVSFAKVQAGGAPWSKESVDYVGHFVGYACGAAYYAIFLWRKRLDDRSKKSKPPRRIANGIIESRAQAGPVRKSEDWKEVASRLGYSTPEGQT